MRAAGSSATCTTERSSASALSLRLRLVANRVAPGSEAEELLGRARKELAEALQELRDLAHGLHPAVLSDHGLAVALESLADRAPLHVDLSMDRADVRSDCTAEAAAYYVVAEALTNVAKYAAATTARVSVHRSKGALHVKIADDGVGGADPFAGSGLRGLQDRVEALGGRLEIRSSPGRGTSVDAEIPCSPRLSIAKGPADRDVPSRRRSTPSGPAPRGTDQRMR